ncbi:MAG TPA: tetratricopeptide repeat protein [Steroidobacteraceae bacterium]|nr:tetratricopeptide repeat protein [Steroidobacteraceae bacterium]
MESLSFRLLGSLELSRGGEVLTLPASRKVRALLGYLVLASRPVARTQICELLWDVPNDPRGELRWCLSKIRGLIDDKGRKRVIADGASIRLDLTDCHVDTLEVTRAPEHGIQKLGVERQRELAALFAGELLEGLEIARSPMFDAWITAERRRFRGIQTVLLENLARALPPDAAAPWLDEWLRLAPFDRNAHELLLNSLARQGRIAEGEAHLASASKLFEADGLDAAPLREIWRQARDAGAPKPSAPAIELVSANLAEIPGMEPRAPAAGRRASIAVMPFIDGSSAADTRGGLADALAHDVIVRLAKLRSMFVIAQGTTFALRDRGVGPEEAGRMLNVDYVVSGATRRSGRRLTVNADLIETRTARVVWAEVFDDTIRDALDVLDEIGNRIVASIAHEIEMMERNRAILKPPNSLDAWEAHHRGLWHMYRFNRNDNERARQFFTQAVELDPTFARAYAGLSFAHFQNAFLGWKKPEPEIERAYEAAGRSLMVDDRDPAAHWAMGRALWLRGKQDQSITELERAVDLSPNFATGHYTLAFVHSQSGDPRAAISASDHSRSLSPFDPMLFAMLGARALGLARLGEYEQAADWALKAAARPNAHQHIMAIAALSLALCGRIPEANEYKARIGERAPNYQMADFLAAFRFSPEDAQRFRAGGLRIGIK